jgi:hypothetical protein
MDQSSNEKRTRIFFFGKSNSEENRLWPQLKYRRHLLRWILIPMMAYKVLVPKVQKKPLNIFQEAILKLLRSGNKSNQQIAELLLLDLQLVELIVAELMVMQFINERRVISRRGEDVLDGYDPLTTDMESGYLFCDLVDGTPHYWDVIVPDDEFVFVDHKSGHATASFSYGPQGKDWRAEKAQFLSVDKSKLLKLPAPDVNVVLSVLQGKRSRSRSAAAKDANLGYRIRVIGEKQLVYVATIVFLPEGTNADWNVCHPFRNTTDALLRRRLVKMGEEATNTFSFKAIVSELIDGKHDISTYKFYAQDKKIVDKGMQIWPQTYGEAILSHIQLFKDLSYLSYFSSEIDRLDKLDHAKYKEEIHEKIESFLFTMEQVTLRMLQHACPVELWNNPFVLNRFNPKSHHANGKMLEPLVESFGFELPNPDERWFLDVMKGRIIHLESSPDLQALFAVNLVTAQFLKESGEKGVPPLAKLAKLDAGFILFLQLFKKQRDRASHDKDYRLAVNDHFKRLQRWLPCMYTDLKLNEKIDLPKVDYSEFHEMDSGLRFHCKLKVHEQFPGMMNHLTYSKLYELLIDSHVFVRRNLNVFLKLSATLEELLSILVQEHVTEEMKAVCIHDVKPEPEQNLQYIINQLATYGVVIDSTKMTNSLKTVKSYKLENAFRLIQLATANRKLLVLLFSVIRFSPDFIKQRKETLADFIYFCDLLATKRSHGSNAIEVDAEEAKKWLQEMEFWIGEYVIKSR